MSNHTPGPWVVVGNLTKYVEARLVGGLIQEVAACGPTMADEGYGQQQEANARLISAAPDLLEALKRCKFDSLNMTIEDREFCRAAIARATGEQP